MTTLKDIAKASGVSVSAVSRILNHDATLSISEFKKLKVIRIAQDLGYQSMKERNSNKYRVALLTKYTTVDEIVDPYYFVIKMGVENYCKHNHMELTLIYENEINKYNGLKFDGAIVLGDIDDNSRNRLCQLVDKKVLVDFCDLELARTSVVLDFDDALKQVFEFASRKGIKRVGMFAGRDDKEDIRLTKFKELSRQYDFEIEDSWIVEGMFSFQGGYEMAMVLSQHTNLPELIFCANDSIAIGAIKAFHEMLIDVPNHVQLIGFNDIPTAAYTIPALSTLAVPMQEMGEYAMKLLHEKINGTEFVQAKMVLPPKLILRGSTQNE